MTLEAMREAVVRMFSLASKSVRMRLASSSGEVMVTFLFTLKEDDDEEDCISPGWLVLRMLSISILTECSTGSSTGISSSVCVEFFMEFHTAGPTMNVRSRMFIVHMSIERCVLT